MGILIFSMILSGLTFSVFLFLMSIASLFEQKPCKNKVEFDNCLLSRYELEKRLWHLNKGNRRMK